MTNRRIGRSILDALGGLPLFATAPLHRHWHLAGGVKVSESTSGGVSRPVTRGTMDPQHPGEMESRCLTRR